MRISQWKTKLLFTVGCLVVVALFYTLRISCIFQTIFGIACPGCGMTRALLAVLRLDIEAAFRYHPMFWSVPLLYFYFLFEHGLFRHKLWDRIVLWGIGGGFFVNWLFKLW